MEIDAAQSFFLIDGSGKKVLLIFSVPAWSAHLSSLDLIPHHGQSKGNDDKHTRKQLEIIGWHSHLEHDGNDKR